jgi:curli biogenesis system outer membrane secretion channel CsgG
MTSLRIIKVALLAGAAAVALSGCVSVNAGADGLYATPIGNAPVTTNPTPYTNALVCLGNYARQGSLSAPRVTVGRIADYTGKVEQDGGGAKITQGASLMAMSAFAKAGARLVERYDTSVSEMELKYTNNQLIGEDNGTLRQISAGQVVGSDYYLVGGITELNYNIHSSGVDIMGGGVNATDGSGLFSRRVFVMNVGLDLRLVDTQTMEVVDVISYQKQIIGREISAGLFTFFGGSTVSADIGAGGKAMEPIQLAVRAVIERAVLEMSTNLYGAPAGICAFDDPLGNPAAAQAYAAPAPVTYAAPAPAQPQYQPQMQVQAQPQVQAQVQYQAPALPQVQIQQQIPAQAYPRYPTMARAYAAPALR